jgi:hypothetical protein
MDSQPDYGEESYRGSGRLKAYRREIVQRTVSELGGIDILVNDAAYQMRPGSRVPNPAR